jgi:hypothetical protein
LVKNILMQDMARTLRFLFVLLFISVAGKAIAQSGAIQGQVLDDKNEPVIGAIVQAIEGGIQKGGSPTDYDGNYLIKPLNPGRYTVKVSYVGFKESLVTGVIVSADKNTEVKIKLEPSSSTALDEVQVVAYKVPLIDKFAGGGTATKTAEEIEKLPTRNTNDIAATTAGVYQNGSGGALSIGGARSDGTLYIVDGIQVRGNAATNLSQNSIDQMQVMTAGLSAKYGDAIGGVINITTKGPSQNYRGGVTLEHSVDGYNHNMANFTLSGPIYSKKEDGIKKPVLGFLVSTDFWYDEDRNPIYGGDYILKKDVLQRLQQAPLRAVPNQSGSSAFRGAAEFVRMEDFELVKKRQNAEVVEGRANAKIDYVITDNLQLTAGGSFNYAKGKNWQRAWAMFAPEAQPISTSMTTRGYLRLTQRFGKAPASAEERKPLISNAYYTLQADYQTTTSSTQHEDHKKDLFKYGYVGKFYTDYQSIYAPTVDDSTGRLGVRLIVDRVPVSTRFVRSDLNPILANYTQQIYDLSTNLPQDVNTIRGLNGLTNGQFGNFTYQPDLFANVGHSVGGYSYSEQNQWAVSVDASFDLQPGKTRHAIEFGLYYQQRIERAFNANGAEIPASGNGIWQYMRQLTNRHISLDRANPIFIVNGNRYTKSQILNGEISPSPYDTIIYNRVGIDSAQSTFDRNLRTKLGLAANNTDYINIDEYDPTFYSLDMFSADELINNGGSNAFVTYNGYTYTGKKQTGQVNFNDFFTKKDANGDFTREIGAYRPNYTAAYILDKFQFKDVLFNVGVRIDRFDANTKVLKDPYSLYEAHTVATAASDSRQAKNILNGGVNPANIGSDYTVYVNNNESASPSIVAYRNGETWYDAFGNELQDPQAISALTGRAPQPFLKDAKVRINDESFDPNTSFTDYTPQVNVMPRIKFSFPISDVALFFAHYDVIVQRPRGGIFGSPVDYLYMTSLNNRIINNPNLKSERLFDYEVGFQQQLTQRSALTITAFYKERKDMITVRPYIYAYPLTYYTFGNRDFSTTKGMTLKYDLRRIGNIRMDVNYTLQFAQGTGSSAASANAGRTDFYQNDGVLQSFVQAGLPNLRFATPLNIDARHNIVATVDYRYDDNEGPEVGGKHIFQNMGLNTIFRTNSGTPYTRYLFPETRVVQGGVNASRLPWRYSIDARLDKDFSLDFMRKKAKDGTTRRELTLNAYVYVQNLLNTRNILTVYGYTSRPDDNGYLPSPQGIQQVNNQIDQQSFIDLYTIDRLNPYAIDAPRTINLGLNFNF